MTAGIRHPITLPSISTCGCLRECECRLTTGLKGGERTFRLLSFQTADSTRVSRIFGKASADAAAPARGARTRNSAPFPNELCTSIVALCPSAIQRAIAIFATSRGLSRNSNVFYPYWGSAHFVIRKLHQLHESGWEAVKEQVIPTAPYRGKTEIYRTPSNSQMTKWLLPKLGKKLARNPLHRDKVRHRRIGLLRADAPKPTTAPSADRSGFQWIKDSPGRFFADPFLLAHNGQTWLFFEQFRTAKKRGRISCGPVGQDLSIGEPRLCLDLPYHLSYPVVFRHNGETFMIPESVANKSVELWRAVDFPFSWKLEKTLFQGSLVDTTPIFHGGRWYFFTAISEPKGNAAFGALFSSDDLTGDWVRHPVSPISTDVRYARSAGAILNVDGRLLRPVQDCSWGYGHCIHVEEILELIRMSTKAGFFMP